MAHETLLVQANAWCPKTAFNVSSTLDNASYLQPIDPHRVAALDGGRAFCATTAAGVSLSGTCKDLGVGQPSSRWRPLYFLPPALVTPPTGAARALGAHLQADIDRLQFNGRGCVSSPVYTVAELVTIGFCATIEHAMLALARASSSGSRLVLGHKSMRVWTSGWLCGRERSLGCYFNLTGKIRSDLIRCDQIRCDQIRSDQSAASAATSISRVASRGLYNACILLSACIQCTNLIPCKPI